MMRRLMLTPTRGGRHGESSTANRVYRSFAIDLRNAFCATQYRGSSGGAGARSLGGALGGRPVEQTHTTDKLT
jgi:hypothetical protein